MRLDCKGTLHRTCRNMALDKVANVKRQHETDMAHAISYTYISRFYGIRYYCIYLSTYQFAQGFYVFSYAYLDTNLWISLHPAKRYINIGHRFCKYRLNKITIFCCMVKKYNAIGAQYSKFKQKQHHLPLQNTFHTFTLFSAYFC